MGMSTAAIKVEIEQFLSSAYSILTREYFLFTLAMMISSVIFPIFIVRVINQYEKNRMLKKGELPKAYVFRVTSKLGLHYAGLIALLIFAVGNVYYSVQLAQNAVNYNINIVSLSVFLMIVAFLAAYYLYKFYVRGLLLTGVLIILYSAYEQYLWWRRACSILDMAENYNPIASYGIYAMVHHLAMQSMILSTLATVLVTLFFLYYYKRRYLFTPGRLNLPFCPYCGMAISKGDNFCICCGKELEVNPIYQSVIRLDEARYCSKCGKSVNSMGCIICDGEKALKEFAKNKEKEKRTSVIRGTLLTVILLALLFLPMMVNPVDKLERGTAKINNTYCERWNEFCQKPENVASADWVAGFDTEIEALYLADMRWYYVNPKIVPYNRLVYYTTYAEASFMQMKALEEMKEFVHNVSSEDIVDMNIFNDEHIALENKLNQTILYQSKATQNFLFEGGIALLWHGICDGINYYTVHINKAYVAVIILIVNICMLLYLLNSFSLTEETALERWSLINGIQVDHLNHRLQTNRHAQFSESILQRLIFCVKDLGCSAIRFLGELWLLIVRLFCIICLFFSLFSIKKMKRCFCWMRNKLTDTVKKKSARDAQYKEFWHRERITYAIICIIIILVLGIPISIRMARINRGETVLVKEQYLSDATMASTGYSLDILDILLDIRNTKTLTEEDREKLYELIDKQIEADEAILAYDTTELEDYAELHAGLCSLCKDDIKAVKSIRTCIEKNEIPSQELQSNYVKLRGQNYSWVVETIGGEYLEMAVEGAFGG